MEQAIHPLGYCESCKQVSANESLTIREGALTLSTGSWGYPCPYCGAQASLFHGVHQVGGELYKFLLLQDLASQNALLSTLRNLVQSGMSVDEIAEIIKAQSPALFSFLPKDKSAWKFYIELTVAVLSFFVGPSQSFDRPAQQVFVQNTVIDKSLNINIQLPKGESEEDNSRDSSPSGENHTPERQSSSQNAKK